MSSYGGYRKVLKDLHKHSPETKALVDKYMKIHVGAFLNDKESSEF